MYGGLRGRCARKCGKWGKNGALDGARTGCRGVPCVRVYVCVYITYIYHYPTNPERLGLVLLKDSRILEYRPPGVP